MFDYIPSNHYWLRADGKTVYSSARDAEVAADDPVYLAWLEGGGEPTPYPKDQKGEESRAELMNVLKPYGLGRYNRILIELDKLDQASIRPLRAIDNSSDTPGDHAKLVEIETRAAALRAELTHLMKGEAHAEN